MLGAVLPIHAQQSLISETFPTRCPKCTSAVHLPYRLKQAYATRLVVTSVQSSTTKYREPRSFRSIEMHSFTTSDEPYYSYDVPMMMVSAWKRTTLVLYAICCSLLAEATILPKVNLGGDDFPGRPTHAKTVSPSQPSYYTRPLSLQKRFSADVGLGWTLEIHDWDLLYPIMDAAAKIEELHNALLGLINRELQFEPERQVVVFQSGALQLRFDCEQGPIGWRIVALIVDFVASAAMQGWQGLYRLRLRHAGTGVVVSAALTVLWYGDGG